MRSSIERGKKYVLKIVENLMPSAGPAQMGIVISVALLNLLL